MKACAWNCRGIKSVNNPVIPYLTWLVNNLAIDFLFLSETKCLVSDVIPVVCKLGFSQWSGCDSKDLSGVPILCWSSKFVVKVLFVAPNYVCCSLKDEYNESFYVSCVYGAPLPWR